jgi:hypothetical protein
VEIGKAKAKEQASADEIEIEPGVDKRLANILKKALKTPPSHRPEAKREKAAKSIRGAKPART